MKRRAPIGQKAQPATACQPRKTAQAVTTNTRRFTPADFFCNNRHMSGPADDEFKLLLAGAFDRAWKRYYRPSRVGAISASVARPALAKHLIALAKQGVVSADALAEGGLLHLVSLTPETRHWGHLRIKGARARFLQVWQFRVWTLAKKK
jgi:hypothetical protein